MKVFVSSPSEDLADVRKQVASALKDRGHDVEAMDTMGPSPDPPLHVSLHAVDRADLYVGLLGHRYGSVPADENPQALSFTELEYRRAQKLEKDCVWFVCTEPAGSPPEPAGHADKLRRLREEILREQVVCMFRGWPDLGPSLQRTLDSWDRQRRFGVELALRYGGRGPSAPRFIVIRDGPDADVRVYRTTARILVSEIRRRCEAHPERKRLVVGVGGGRAHKKIVEQLENAPDLVGTGTSVGVTFVALNSAAIPFRYSYTANFLVTRLSEIFPGAQHLACIPNAAPKHAAEHQEAMKELDLVLGGAAGRDGFLAEWLRGFRHETRLPEEAVGDLCYVPIDAKGHAVPVGALQRELAAALNLLNVRLRFSEISEIGSSIILPLLGQPQESAAGGGLTRKGLIGHTVLSSARVSHCVLTESTARDVLEMQLCGHVLQRFLGSDEEGGERYEATRTCDSATIDLRVVHQSSQLHFPEIGVFEGDPDVEVLISDPPDTKYDARSVPVIVGRDAETFEVTPGVRRPGLWSATAVRVARRLLHGRSDVAILDMGCGSGAVGCMLSRYVACRSVTFADISEAAIRAARANAARLVAPATQKLFVVTDLLAALSGKYDMIIFSPPYLPDVVRTENDCADRAGRFGKELGVKFARQVGQFLKVKGYAVIYLADYVQSDDIRSALERAGLVVTQEHRKVLYPYDAGQWPPCYEIRWRERLEALVKPSSFRDEVFHDEALADTKPTRYLAFGMRHLLAQLPG
jgi:predicted RNA methylase